MSPTFRSLSVRNYRLFATGQVVSLSGTWGQRVAQDWLVLDLTDNSGTALGIVTALQFLPVLLFGLWGGLLADRHDKRRLLLYAQVSMGLLALTLGLLDVAGVVELWHVYALAFLLGVATVVDTPTRQAFVSEMVGPSDVANAVSLNSATFNGARIVGPAVAGVAIAQWGTATVFLGNAASYVAVVAGLLMMRPDELIRSARQPARRGQLREGLRYVQERRDLAVPLLLVFMIGTFGLNFQITLSLVAKQVFERDASSFGLLASAFAFGSLVGALMSARRSAPTQRRMVLAALAFGVLELAVGFAPTFESMMVLLVPTGMAVLIFTTTANALVQLGSDAAVRGRVMALYVLVFLGGTPLGAPVIGVVAEHFGPRTSLTVGGAVCALAALAAGALLSEPQTRRYRGALTRMTL